MCEQCHLKGSAAVLQPGKQWWDFQPGQKLESIAIHYVEAAPNSSIVAVSHAEQLSLSRCVRASANRLWCGSCHNPHPAVKSNRAAQIREVCSSCHPAATLAANHTSPQTADCVACHMPRKPAADVAHAAITDHRIVRYAGEAPPIPSPRIVPWKPDDSPASARNAALGWFAYAQKTRNSEVIEEAYRRLESLSGLLRDAEVMAATGYLLLEAGKPQPAVAQFQNAVQADSANAEYRLDLAVAQHASGATSAALDSLQRAIALDPYDYRPYLAAAKIYDRLRNPDQARRIIQRYLFLDPQSLTMRLSE